MAKVYKIFIDENFPPQLARGLNILQHPLNMKETYEIEVLSIKDEFGIGTKDEDWIPLVGERNGFVITQDYQIQRTKHQRDLYEKHNVGIFFFSAPKSGFPYWDMVKQFIEKWESIKTIIKRDKPPFAYRCSARKPFEKV